MLNEDPEEAGENERAGRAARRRFNQSKLRIIWPSAIGVGCDDFTTPLGAAPGGTQKTLRHIVFLRETAHFVHNLPHGTPMEVNYLTNSELAALLHVAHEAPPQSPFSMSILGSKNFSRLKSMMSRTDSIEVA
jgi:hypothetical protein